MGTVAIQDDAEHTRRQKADQLLKAAREEERSQLIAANASQRNWGERLWSLRGGGGSEKSRRKFASETLELVNDSQRYQASDLHCAEKPQQEDGEMGNEGRVLNLSVAQMIANSNRSRWSS